MQIQKKAFGIRYYDVLITISVISILVMNIELAHGLPAGIIDHSTSCTSCHSGVTFANPSNVSIVGDSSIVSGRTANFMVTLSDSPPTPPPPFRGGFNISLPTGYSYRAPTIIG